MLFLARAILLFFGGMHLGMAGVNLFFGQYFTAVLGLGMGTAFLTIRHYVKNN